MAERTFDNACVGNDTVTIEFAAHDGTGKPIEFNADARVNHAVIRCNGDTVKDSTLVSLDVYNELSGTPNRFESDQALLGDMRSSGIYSDVDDVLPEQRVFITKTSSDSGSFSHSCKPGHKKPEGYENRVEEIGSEEEAMQAVIQASVADMLAPYEKMREVMKDYDIKLPEAIGGIKVADIPEDVAHGLRCVPERTAIIRLQ